MKNIYIFLVVVIILGFFLRFFRLGDMPISLHRDEAFLGYNAYSILKTGNDISGIFLPFHLESFLFSPAGYSYFSIPFLALFGLNDFSIRAASAFFGLLTIPLVFLITINLFHKHNKKKYIALFSAFFIAISPWHINLSRVAVENTIVTFFVCLGVLSFLIYQKKKSSPHVIIGFISFGITLLIYQASRIFVPIFIPFIHIVLNYSRSKKNIHFLLLYLFLIIIPVFYILFSEDLSWRVRSLSIISEPGIRAIVEEQAIRDHIANVPYWISRVFHNNPIGIFLFFINNFFNHLSFNFLFYDGNFPDRFRIPQMGLLYFFELPLIVAAFYYLSRKYKKIIIFLSGWILIALMGSALTFHDVPNMQRVLIAAPAFSIISGYGLFVLFEFSKNIKKFRRVIMPLIIFVMIFNISYFFIQYFVQGKFYMPWYRQDGYKELVKEVNKILPEYKRVIVTSRESAPTIFFLLYSKYEPIKFQKDTSDIDLQESDHVDFYKYDFSDEECPLRIDKKTLKSTGRPNFLYVNSGLCSDDLSNFNIIKTIKRVDDSIAYYVLEAGL